MNALTKEKPRRNISPLDDPVNVHRLPPHSVEAEQGVLGSILASPVTILEAQEKITRDHFYVPSHAVIWDALVKMYEEKKGIDIITVTQELRDLNFLDAVGGAGFVTSLFTFVPTAANIEHYLDIMRDKFVLRETIRACTEAVRRAYDEQDEVQPLLDEVQGRMTAIALNKLEQSPLRQINEDVSAVLDEFENAKRHRGRTQGIATGFIQLDRMTNGLSPGEMIVVAARPSMGKTAFVMNIAEHAACSRTTDIVSRKTGEKWQYKGIPVAIFSLETSRHRLVRRMMCGNARVNLQRLRDGHLKGDDIPKLTEAASKLMAAPIYIDETPALRLFEFKARARYAVVSLGVKLIAIDYVQLMTAESKRPAENPFERAMELTRISATIKAVARELNIPIITIAQLNREAEKNQSGRPRMSNLRECGALEQDADHVWLIWREEYYANDEEDKKATEGEAELILAKHKDGPTGTIKLTFLKQYTRFETRAGEELYSNDPEKRQEGYQDGEDDNG